MKLAAGVLRKRSAPCLVVLDRDYRIVIAEPRLQSFISEAGMVRDAPDRLPEPIENVVRNLTENSLTDENAVGETAVLVTGLIVRTSVLVGPSGTCIAVSLERLQSRDPLRSAAHRYHLSKREREVLELMLEGLEAREIGERLNIAESTVCEYFKHLYAKIGVNKRSAMLARVFEWPQA